MTIHDLLNICDSDWMYVILRNSITDDIILSGEFYDIKSSEYWNHNVMSFSIDGANTLNIRIFTGE